MRKPLAIDLFCGLGGWTDGLLAEGWDVIGFDIEQHQYWVPEEMPDTNNGGKGTKPIAKRGWTQGCAITLGMEGANNQPRTRLLKYPAQLVVQDVLTLHGSQFRNADLIVASPPCQEYSYMAMPWSKAKAIAVEYRSGVRDVKQLTALFDACFRIQREACEASGRHIPLIVENVRGAIPWVGRSRWNFGSFHLWGDVPALMPPTLGGRKSTPGGADVWFGNYAAMKEGIKQRGSGREWFAGDGKISRMTSSKSPARKAASAMIAKIPLPLSRHIAVTFKPELREAA